MDEWLERVKQGGWSNTLLTILDVIEPFAPFIGQWLLALQPPATLIGGNEVIRDLASLLEEADGVNQLRQRLKD